MQVLLKLQPRPPPWAAWSVPDRPVLAGYPSPERMDAWRAFVRAAAERTEGGSRGIEIENEPTSASAPSEAPLEEGAGSTRASLRAGGRGRRPAIVMSRRRARVSENDFHGGFKFSGAVLDRIPGGSISFTAIPTRRRATSARGKLAVGPEENDLPGLCRSSLDFLEEARPAAPHVDRGAGLGARGERAGARRQLAGVLGAVARALILARTSRSEKFLWFTQIGCTRAGTSTGSSAAGPAYPLPAACAYARARACSRG